MIRRTVQRALPRERSEAFDRNALAPSEVLRTHGDEHAMRLRMRAATTFAMRHRNNFSAAMSTSALCLNTTLR